MSDDLAVPPNAIGMRLHKVVGGRLVACHPVRFAGGSAAVNTVLRRAAISGRVVVGRDIRDHFADLLDENEDIVETVALDADSYRALKVRWLRCREDRSDG